jgi:hypothetical protein
MFMPEVSPAAVQDVKVAVELFVPLLVLSLSVE